MCHKCYFPVLVCLAQWYLKRHPYLLSVDIRDRASIGGLVLHSYIVKIISAKNRRPDILKIGFFTSSCTDGS
uniref:Uncharacterized protein n=1 Tax=Anguilla anguilla TaxID=7936 RepID=A0A0E9PQH9_ANGAN